MGRQELVRYFPVEIDKFLFSERHLALSHEARSIFWLLTPHLIRDRLIPRDPTILSRQYGLEADVLEKVLPELEAKLLKLDKSSGKYRCPWADNVYKKTATKIKNARHAAIIGQKLRKEKETKLKNREDTKPEQIDGQRDTPPDDDSGRSSGSTSVGSCYNDYDNDDNNDDNYVSGNGSCKQPEESVKRPRPTLDKPLPELEAQDR